MSTTATATAASLAPPAAAQPPRWAGWLAMGLTLLIWASFPLSVRAIGGSSLGPLDVALLRFAVPSLVLLPWLPSRWARLRALPWRLWVLIAGGAGLPFLLVAALGARVTSASHVSALIAGTTPLSYALLAAWLWRQPVPRATWPGLALIVAGVAAMVAALGSPSWAVWQGAAVLLVASGLWSCYTHGLRLAGLDPLSAMMVVSYPSLLLTLTVLGSGLVDSRLPAAPWPEVLLFAGVQGVAVGLVSTFCYTLSIRLLGAPRCSLAGAMAPVLTTVLAVPLLGEWPQAMGAVGLLSVSAGVVLSVRATAPRAARGENAPGA